MKRTSAVLLAVALSGSLAACGDDGPDDTSAASSTSGPTATSSPTPSAEPTSAGGPTPAPSPSADEDADAAMPFPADTAVDVEQPSGGPLTVTAVRVARHDGYDRVVFELDGEASGEPGWRVEYVDEPTQQGSGNPVEVDGEAALAVTITGTGYPFDTGVEEASGDPSLPSGLEVVEDVRLGGVFEGQYEAFIGTSSKAPFRVFRLEDPARVVVDIATG